MWTSKFTTCQFIREHSVVVYVVTQTFFGLSVCFPAPLCWTPCSLNQQHFRTPQSRKHCSMTLSTPSAGLCFDAVYIMFSFPLWYCDDVQMCLCVLYSKGFVEGRHIMKLRQQLQKHGYSNSFTTDEKGQLNVEALDQLMCFTAVKRMLMWLLSFRPRGVPHCHHAPYPQPGPSTQTVGRFELSPHTGFNTVKLWRMLHSLFACFLLWHLAQLVVNRRRVTAIRSSWTRTTAWFCLPFSSCWNIPSTVQNSSWKRWDAPQSAVR